MVPLGFHSYPLWLLIAIFSGAAVAVWIAGTRLSRYAGIISDRTGIGQALVGLILLGGITSLPEIATSVTASWTGNAALAVNNILGGVAMQVTVLAIGDFFLGRSALTGTLPRPHVIIQAAFSIVLLALVAAGIVVRDTMLFGVGAWAFAVLIAYFVMLWVAQAAEVRVVWVLKEPDQTKREKRVKSDREERQDEGDEEAPTSRVVSKTVAAAATILVAGFLITRTGESIAEATGLGQSFFGAVFVAICTSLPELSSVISAVRLGREMLAIGDVLGGNLFDLALIFLIDAIYSGGPVLNEVGAFSVFAALLGILLTTLYVIGMIERRDRAVLRMGYDSLAVLVCYGVGLVLLYNLR
jgi:cation:H+ antiporter